MIADKSSLLSLYVVLLAGQDAPAKAGKHSKVDKKNVKGSEKEFIFLSIIMILSLLHR